LLEAIAVLTSLRAPTACQIAQTSIASAINSNAASKSLLAAKVKTTQGLVTL